MTTSDPIADEWVAGWNGKWPKQEWTLGERRSDLGETLESWRDAAEQHQLVFGSRLRGKSEIKTVIHHHRYLNSERKVSEMLKKSEWLKGIVKRVLL